MLRKKNREKIKKFDKSNLESFKIRFRQNSDENPQKEETGVTKNNGVGNNDKK
jgi:hypothetical protein